MSQVSRRTVLGAAAALAASLRLSGTPVWANEAPEGFDPGLFAEPPADSRPTILWFWNGTVTPDLVDAQLAEMRARGVDEVLVFPFDTPAIRPVFFSEEWFAIIEHTLREAQRHKMLVWLFNDDIFPSGRAGGFVVNGGRVGDRVYPARPELRLNGVARADLVVDGGRPIALDGLGSRGLAVSDGRLVVDAAMRDGVTVLRDGAGWTDYDVTATVRIDRATAGLMVRCADALNGYLVDLRADGGISVWRHRDGAFALLDEGPPTAGFDPAADHQLGAVLRGGRIVPSIDGVAQREIVDATFPAGRVGVRAVASQRSRWDRLTVTGAGGDVLFAEEFTDAAALDAFDLPPADPDALVAMAARPESTSDPAAIVDLTEPARAGQPWQAPAGRWRIDTFTARELADLSGNFRRNYLDLLDDEAVRLFLDIVPGEYLRRFGWAVEAGVLRGFADDEPFIASADAHFGAIPWSASLEPELARLGATPATALSAVYDDLGAGGRRLRGVFWRAVSNRFAAAYYRQQGEWMAEHGVAFISNPLWDEYGPAEQIRSTGNLNTLNQWAQEPGTDLVFDHYQRGYHRMLSRWPASTAHQLGLDRVYVEAMGAMGWWVPPALVREVIGSFAVRGVNHTLLHAAFSDERQIFYPPPFQPANPWWPLSEPLNVWIGRVMQAGRAVAEAPTALVQPQRAAEAVQDTPAVEIVDSAFIAAAHALEDRQIDFDLLDEGALDGDPALRVRARPQGGRLVVGRQAYRAVVLPSAPRWSARTVETLAGFTGDGGTVVVIGELATEEAGGDDGALRRAWQRLFASGRAVRAANPAGAGQVVADRGHAAARLSPAVAEVRVLRLRRDRQPAFLVVNERAEQVTVTATFPATGVPQLWDPDTGAATPAGVWRADRDATAVPLALGPKATVLVVFAPAREPVPHAISSTAPVRELSIGPDGARAVVEADRPGTLTVVAVDGQRTYRGSRPAGGGFDPVPLDGDWEFAFRRDGAPTVSRPLGSWTDLDPAFSGTGVYRRRFDLDPAGRRWTLDLGTVREVAAVRINDHPLPVRLWPPYTLDVTDLLHPGTNLVQVEVTNTGANTRNDPRPSGLEGPAHLRPTRLLEVPLH